MILQSMTAKVLEQKQSNSNNEKNWIDHELISFEKVKNYAKFLTMPLELGFFVPVDKDGNVLEEPKPYRNWLKSWVGQDGFQDCEAYQQAIDNVIFEGFEKCDRQESFDCLHNEKLNLHIPISFEFNKNIESLVKYGLTITETAIKKYNL